VLTVVIAGAAAVTQSAYRLYATPLEPQWLILAVLTLLTGSFTVKVPAINVRISVSETFVFASVLLFGVAAGTITVLLESLIILLWMAPAGRPLHRLLFNLAAPAVAIWVSGSVFFLVSGIEPYSAHATPLRGLFIPLGAFTALYFLLNSWLVAFAVGLETGTSPFEIWWTNFIWLSVNYFSGASVAALIVTYTRQLDISTLAVIVPLLVVSYLTFKTAMGRVEDSNNHLSQLNRLYISTIETLAMAIDAKDQVTHGHIRRVQLQATHLAREVGVRDEKLLKAIEAAALLHDMGKLAVPEYILNKPGKLTEAEFEKMKLHADVGADILSAIEFPYPVVPIVRHHHENWDGTGYPAGIKGTDIPIGARILSVVDCFDALTSDRPYRQKLPDEQAIAILIQRRGSMYDPLIVDTFLRVHATTPKELPRQGPASEVLNTIARSRHAPLPELARAPLDEIAARADEMLNVYELARALAGQMSLSDAGDVIAKHLRRLIPSSLIVFYLYDRASDGLEARHVVGEGASAFRGMKIGLGQRLSGWVAANRQTISNSDPALDLGDAARSHSPRLRSCISTPLVADDLLVGVLALYSGEENAFNDDHRRIIEIVAREMAPTLKRASEFDNSVRRDALTGLPGLEQLEQVVDAGGVERLAHSARFTLLFIDVVGLTQINDTHGRNAGDEVLRHVARHTTAGLRVADILFRYGSGEFVALLDDTNSETGQAVARRIRENISASPLASRPNRSLLIDVSVTTVSAPDDGDSLADLIAAAHLRASEHSHDESTVH
jgi:diguanylate cyclase (GGDEF)-like protein/putative nucleotidyltransferase with HDIG domain